MSQYEPCVLGVDGQCTRWSHDHTPQPLARIRAEQTTEHDTNGDPRA